jgi:hypothetical protein
MEEINYRARRDLDGHCARSSPIAALTLGRMAAVDPVETIKLRRTGFAAK